MVLDPQTYRCDCEEGFHGALCNLQKQPAGSCRGLRCLHGRCQKTKDGEGCVCDPGYSGESCDTGEGALTVSRECDDVYVFKKLLADVLTCTVILIQKQLFLFCLV